MKERRLRDRVIANRDAQSLGSALSWNEQLALLDLAAAARAVLEDDRVPAHHRANIDTALDRFDRDAQRESGEWHPETPAPPAQKKLLD